MNCIATKYGGKRKKKCINKFSLHHNPNFSDSSMSRQVRYTFLALAVVVLNIHFAIGQASFADEAEFKKHANKLFEDDEFEQAYPLFSQLLSVYPKDPDYNYRFGVCTLFASDDKEKAIPFLEFSENKDVEKEVMYYLAKAYHLNYRFDDAIAEYTKYKKVASANKASKLQVDRQIEMCKNGKQLLHSLKDLSVIEKKEMNKAEFYRAYDISQIGGKLLVKPDEKQFKTAIDKKKKDNSIIYLSKDNNQIFFSSYGEDGTKGKEIFTTNRLENGEFSKPVSLGAPVNTDFDEDYPFLHPNGKDLFFCSKGHNSMGGYDVFKTTYNEATKKWSEPENLDFPINTPDDDILFVTDSSEKQAYFSSARASITGKTEVYHINTERKPIDAAVISGNVIKNRDEQKLNLKITVKNLADNTIIGIYNTLPTDGSYSMNLPNGGKFLFTVESAEFPIQSEVVVIPIQDEFKPIKQEISYEVKTDKLVVKTIFDGAGGDSNYLMALKFIREKSKMNVNDVVVVVKPEPVVPSEPLVKSTKPQPGTKLSNEDIIKIANDDAKVVESEAKDAQEQADIALMYANQKNEQAQNKSKEASDLFDAARGSSDNVKKQTLTEKANATKQEADQLNEETVNAFNLAKKLELSAQSKQKEADLSKEYAKDLEIAVKSKNSTQAMAKLDEQEKKLEELSKENEGVPAITNSLKLDVETKKKALDKAVQSRNDLKQEIADNETIIASTKADAEGTKNADLKKGLMTQIEELLTENKTKQKELEDKEARVTQAQKEYNGIRNQSELINSVVEQAKVGSSEVAAATAATIDKNKLEEKVNEIKKSTEAEAYALAATKLNDTNNQAIVKDTKVNNAQPKTETKELASNNKQTSNPTTNANEKKEVASTTKKENAVNSKVSTEVATNKDENELKTEEASNKENSSKLISQDTSNTKQDSKTLATESKQDQVKETNSVASKSNKDNTNQPKVENKKENSVESKEEVKNESATTLSDLNTKFADEITATSKLTNEVEKEKAKTEVLKNWNVAINEHIEKQKEELKTTSNLDDKRVLIKQISDAEQLSKDIQSQTKESVAKVEILNKKVETKSTDASVTSTNASETKIDEDLSKQEYSVINKKYTDEISETNKIENNTEREKAKSVILKNWNKTIADKITKQKEEVATISNPEEKQDAIKKINEAEALSKEVTAQAKESENKLATLKKNEIATASNSSISNEVKKSEEVKKDSVENKQEVKANTEQPIATISEAPNVSYESINQKYSSEINSTNAIQNNVEREQKKLEVLNSWNNEINVKINSQKADLKTTKNVDQKKAIVKQINAAEQYSKELLAQTKESNTRLDSLRKIPSNSIASNQTSDLNKETKNDVNQNSKTSTLESVNKDTTTNDAKESLENVKTNQIKYSSSKAKDEFVKAEQVNKQANELSTQSAELRSKAESEQNPEEKQKLMQQSEELAKQAENKKLESNNSVAEINKSEFQGNQNQLEQLANASKNNKSDDISMAELMNDDAKVFFDKAEKLRKEAESSTTYLAKESALNDASNNETIAIEKQQKALEIYQKQNPNFVASANYKTSVQKPNSTKTELKNEAIDQTQKQNVVASTTKEDSKKSETTNVKGSKPITQPVTKDTSNSNSSLAIVSNNEKQSKEKENKAIENKVVAKTSDVKATESSSSKDEVKDAIQDTKLVTKTKSKEQATKKELADNNSNSLAVNEKVSVNQNKSTLPNLSAIRLAPNELFEKKNTAVYSAKKPIPVNEKLPEGLVYKVQIGAFKNPIPQNLFKGITPIAGETTSQGLTRYMAGVFVKYTTADFAKNQIRDFGYRDAFVVAFLNGKRIPINQALAMNGLSPINTNSKNTEAASTIQQVPTENAKIAESSITKQQPSEPKEIAPTKNITTIGGGLFYTVQVGVYSQPVTAEKLYNVLSLYTETAPNGNLRYNVGIYNNTGKANEAKVALVETGLKDAFVTAYYNGKRISLAEAKQLESQGNITFANGPNLNALPKFSISNNGQTIVLPSNEKSNDIASPIVDPKESNKQETVNSKAKNEQSVIKQKSLNEQGSQDSTKKESKSLLLKNNEIKTELGIIFKVQIGAFKDEVPLEIANKFLKVASKGIKNYVDEKGLTIYTVGSFSSYEEASKMKSELVTAELTDAFIVAYNDGNKISVDEAKTLLKK